QASSATLRDRCHHRALDEHRLPVLLDRQRQIVQRPGGVLERPRERPGAFDLKTVFGNLGDPDDHGGKPRSTLDESARRQPSNFTRDKMFRVNHVTIGTRFDLVNSKSPQTPQRNGFSDDMPFEVACLTLRKPTASIRRERSGSWET